jgi:hypothetical protein
MKLAALWLAVLWLAAAACGDELSLDVRVTHPPEAAIARTVVSIYESNTTTCRQIEYGDLSTAELSAILVAEQTVSSGAGARGSLDGISRRDRKLVVARGYDAQDRFLTAGCYQQEEITGHDVAPVATDFTATLSISALTPGELTIPLTLTDAEGRSLGGHPVTWRVYGPDDAVAGTTGAMLAPPVDSSWELAAPTCTNEAGVARVHPVPPSRVGGYAIALRPSWPAQPSSLLTSFTRIDPTVTPTFPKASVTRPCAIRVAGGAPSLVCLQLTAVGGALIAREYTVALQSGNARLIEGTAVAVNQTAVALFSIERESGARDVYAINEKAQVFGVFSPTMAPDPSPHLPPAPNPDRVTDALLVPACEAGQAPQLLVRVDQATTAEKRLYTAAATGGPLADYHGISTDAALELAIRGTGCITELRPSGTMPRRRQAAVVDVTQRVAPMQDRNTASVVFECDQTNRAACRVSLPAAGGGAVLSQAPRPGTSSTEEPRLTGTFVDASGVVMSSWVLLPTFDGQFLLVERGRVPSAAIPHLALTGHFDGDGISDMFWDLPNVLQQSSNLQVTYGRMIGTQRLSALSGAEPILVDDAIAGDLTGDDLDDVVLVGRQRRDSQTSTNGLIVVPMNVAIPNPDTAFDKPCQ